MKSVGGSIPDPDKCTDIFVRQSIKKNYSRQLHCLSHNTAKRQILCVTVFVVIHCWLHWKLCWFHIYWKVKGEIGSIPFIVRICIMKL